jgi:hypothetical protein
MTMKKRIIIYTDKNDPYLESLREGMKDTPEERYIKFFENRRKYNQFMGIKKDPDAKKTIEIKKADWF